MKLGNILVDQVLSNGTLIEGYDNILSVSEIYNKLLEYFPNIIFDTTHHIILGEYNKNKYAIRCKNITYLGNPHPVFKKRIQISNDLFEFYKTAKKLSATPLLLGIYSHADNTVFVDFKIDTYINKKAHNSSAHVYSSDLVAATIDGFFQKIDYFDNCITAFRSDLVSVFFETLFPTTSNAPSEISKKTVKPHIEFHFEESKEGKNAVSFDLETSTNKEHEDYISQYYRLLNTRVIPNIKMFFGSMNKSWLGTTCYQEMFDANYSKKGQAEWTGSYLEFIFENYLDTNNLHNIITFYQDRSEKGIDLDLFFPELKSFGDLKAHSISSRGIPGNDYETVMSILDQNNISSHIYYIIAEHTVNKDSDYNNEVAILWNTLLKKDDLLSYAAKMKHDVKIVKAYILDINPQNKEYLSIFRQGINSNGKPRAPKIMIEHNNLEHFVIEEINL